MATRKLSLWGGREGTEIGLLQFLKKHVVLHVNAIHSNGIYGLDGSSALPPPQKSNYNLWL
jgi:hypothetical protein